MFPNWTVRLPTLWGYGCSQAWLLPDMQSAHIIPWVQNAECLAFLMMLLGIFTYYTPASVTYAEAKWGHSNSNLCWELLTNMSFLMFFLSLCFSSLNIMVAWFRAGRDVYMWYTHVYGTGQPTYSVFLLEHLQRHLVEEVFAETVKYFFQVNIFYSSLIYSFSSLFAIPHPS